MYFSPPPIPFHAQPTYLPTYLPATHQALLSYQNKTIPPTTFDRFLIFLNISHVPKVFLIHPRFFPSNAAAGAEITLPTTTGEEAERGRRTNIRENEREREREPRWSSRFSSYQRRRKEGLAAKSSRRRRVNVKALKRKWDRRGKRTDRRQGALDLLVDDGKRKEDRTRERETLEKGEERDQDHLFPPPYPN